MKKNGHQKISYNWIIILKTINIHGGYLVLWNIHCMPGLPLVKLNQKCCPEYIPTLH